MDRPIAVGIVSGGLDSLLSVRVIQEMGIEVIALHFVIGFEPRHLRRLAERPGEPFEAPPPLQGFGAKVEVHDLRSEYLALLAAPAHGYGSHLNPCIDCHAMMLDRARLRMEALGAQFVFSGEVLGQRPMSQNAQSLAVVARESGLGDRLVRPLSGRLLPPTAPERLGLFRRDQLLDFSGRSRSPQIELAFKLGVRDYPAPAGGCLLTDPGFTVRLRDLIERRAGRPLLLDDPLLLSLGRHIVLPSGAKVVIGRDQAENDAIERFAPRGVLLFAEEIPGPTALLEAGSPSDIEFAAALVARYGKGKARPTVAVHLRDPSGLEQSLQVAPREPSDCKLL